MTREGICELLSTYHQNRARLKHLDHELSELRKELEKEQGNIVEELISITSFPDGMPHAHNANDPTGIVAQQVASGKETWQVMQLKAEISRIERESENLSSCVAYVDIWLDGLSKKEYTVIHSKYMDGETWPETIKSFEVQHGATFSKSGLQRILKSGLEKIYQIAKGEQQDE